MAKQNFWIDKITNSIEDVITGTSFDTDVIAVSKENLKPVLKKNGWQFNWKAECKYEERQIYRLVISGNSEIQGLISLQAKQNYVEMHLIEAAPHNFGRRKKYLGVAGNLVAFACMTSYDMGFEGAVAFTAKTRLIQHYMDTLGAEVLFGNRMGISEKSAQKLVNSYYKTYFNGK